MSDTFVAAIPIQVLVPSTNLQTSSNVTQAERYPVPFNYELLGVYFTCGVAPTKVAVAIDILVSKVNATGKVSVFGGTIANMPQVALTGTDSPYDCGVLAVPTVQGDVSSILEGPIVEPGGIGGAPTGLTEPTNLAEQGVAWGTGYQPGMPGADQVSGDAPFGALSTPTAQSAGSPWAQPSGSSALVQPYWGLAGDVFQVKVAQGDYSGSAGAAANGVVTIWVTKR